MKHSLKIITISAIILFSQICKAQSKEELNELITGKSSNTISVSIGPAIPLGEFGEIEINDEKAGLAKMGVQLKVDLTFPISESFYFSAQGGLSTNPIDEEELLLPIKNNFPSLNTSVSTTNWNARFLNVAVGTKTPLDLKSYFITKFGVGLHSLSSPKLEYTLSDGQITETTSQTSRSSTNVNINLGMLMETEINSNTFFRIGIDYYRAAHSFEDVQVTYNLTGVGTGPQNGGDQFDFDQNFENISITVGLTFRI